MNKLLILISSLFSVFSIAQVPQVLTPEVLWKFGRVSEPRISSNGKAVLYSVTYYDVALNKGNSDIWKVAADGTNATKLTSGAENEFNARWMPDGKIAYLNDKDGEAELWMMNWDGTGKKPINGIPKGIGCYGFSPLGNYLFFTKDVKVDKTIAELYPDLPKSSGKIIDALMYRHWNYWEDQSYSHIFICKVVNGFAVTTPEDIMKGERWDAPLAPFGDDDQISFNNDGSRLAYTCKKNTGTEAATSTNSEIYVYNVYSQKTENLSIGCKGYDVNPKFSPDGTQLMWLSMATPGYENDKNNILIYDFGMLARQEYTDKFMYSVGKAEWTLDGTQIYFIAGINATEQVFSLTLGEKPVISQVTKGDFDITDISLGRNGKNNVMVASLMSMSAPSEIYNIALPKGTTTRITQTNTDMLARTKLGRIEKRSVTATDGKKILTWVIFPPDFNPKKKYPALLYCQGGPQSTVSQFWSYRWNFQLMAANGYIVVAPNRRGLPSFGQEWTDQIAGDWGGQAMKDLLSAMDDVSKEIFVNTDRLGCVGASYGGYSVYWLAGNHQKRFKAFIAHCGVFNLESMYGSTEETFFVNHDLKGPYWVDANASQYDSFSPHRYVKNWDTPMLIIHNEKDFRVPVTQGMEAFTAAQLKNIPSRFLYFPDEGHWVTKPQNGILWQRVFFDWLDKFLK